MDNIHEEYEKNNPYLYDVIDTTDEDEQEMLEEDDDEEESSEDYSSSSSTDSYRCRKKILGSSSRMSWFPEWDRVFPLISALCLFIDPTFFYTLALNEDSMCFFIDGWFALGLSLVRFSTDCLHFWNMWHRYFGKDCPRSSLSAADAYWFRRIISGLALQNFKGKMDFFLYVFVILPLPQVRNY